MLLFPRRFNLLKVKKSSVVQPYNNTASGAKLYHELNLKEETLKDGITYQGLSLPCPKVERLTTLIRGAFRSAAPPYTPLGLMCRMNWKQTYKGLIFHLLLTQGVALGYYVPPLWG
jgi:hypothetical protein